jgi:hypothetical protein
VLLDKAAPLPIVVVTPKKLHVVNQVKRVAAD